MREALHEVGISAKQGSSVTSMREALKAHYKGKDLTPRAVFDLLDEDHSGFLDRDELEKASSMLSSKLGYVMSDEEQNKLFSRMVWFVQLAVIETKLFRRACLLTPTIVSGLCGMEAGLRWWRCHQL